MGEEVLLKNSHIFDCSAAFGIDNLAAVAENLLGMFQAVSSFWRLTGCNLPGGLEKLWVQKWAHGLPKSNASCHVLQQELNLPPCLPAVTGGGERGQHLTGGVTPSLHATLSHG